MFLRIKWVPCYKRGGEGEGRRGVQHAQGLREKKGSGDDGLGFGLLRGDIKNRRYGGQGGKRKERRGLVHYAELGGHHSKKKMEEKASCSRS